MHYFVPNLTTDLLFELVSSNFAETDGFVDLTALFYPGQPPPRLFEVSQTSIILFLKYKKINQEKKTHNKILFFYFIGILYNKALFYSLYY